MTDDYAPFVRGGLKLKSGSKPTGITKKKKKKSKEPAEAQKSALQSALEDEDVAEKEGGSAVKEGEQGAEVEEGEELRELESRGGDGKTASERAREEMRRKRLNDRLQREGVKTHKQRVEELNKYLSNLSEHHDMPRIGPG